MSYTVLNVRNLQVEFQTDEKRVLAVDDISFELKRSQTLGIVGESGSGKSVTSLAVMGLVPHPGKIAAGEIWFRSYEDNLAPVNLRDLSADQMRQYRGGKISMIFQEPMSSLNPVFTCGFQLTEAIRLQQNVTPAEARRQACARLQEVKLLPSDEELKQSYLKEGFEKFSEREINRLINEQKLAMLDRYPHELSGGQLQRMMIAMAISCNPDVLIADEPTTALDVTVQATILDLLRELRDQRGMSMLFITHDLGIIAEIADVVAVMYQGKIVEYGPVEQIFSNPQHPYTKGLLTCRPRLDKRLRRLPTVSDFMEVVTAPNGEVEIREKTIETNGAGKGGANDEEADPWESDINLAPFSEEVSPAQMNERLAELQQNTPILSVNNLQVGFPVRGVLGETKRYFMAVDNVSFDVYPGETLGLVGESGCGKSTLARTILRLIKPMSGQIKFNGRDVTYLNNNQLRILRREMQIIFQNPFSSLDPRMKIGPAVMEPLLIHGIAYKSRREKSDRVAYLLDRVGLNPNWINRYPHELSGGQRQRVSIARALALNPKFVICDESVSALDVSVQAQVLNLLKELQGEFKLTYIFISHDLSVVKFMSDRILVMNKGKIEEIGPSERIYREPQQEYTRKLIASIPTGTLERIHERQAQRTAVR